MNPVQIGRGILAQAKEPNYSGDLAVHAEALPVRTVSEHIEALDKDIKRCKDLCTQLHHRLEIILPEPQPCGTDGPNKTLPPTASPLVLRIQFLKRELNEACTMLVYLLERIEL